MRQPCLGNPPSNSHRTAGSRHIAYISRRCASSTSYPDPASRHSSWDRLSTADQPQHHRIPWCCTTPSHPANNPSPDRIAAPYPAPSRHTATYHSPEQACPVPTPCSSRNTDPDSTQDRGPPDTEYSAHPDPAPHPADSPPRTSPSATSSSPSQT